MFYHPKTNQRDFEYTNIKVSVKDTDADDLYVECIHVAAVLTCISYQQSLR
ncbi:hypothetical protein P4256_29855 [Bacillus wiedmannii]|uniref:hypothetical protein n=1 Tax=Bacillus wiedmannii TaxID=1890302 RepID=UPI002E204730|nr:hypothetical protein [Bacillus wiedmannii]